MSWWLENVRAKHPGIELFACHPEIGLEQQRDGALRLPSGPKLGLRWLTLTEEEQRSRLRDLLRGVLEEAAAGEDAGFAAMQWEAGEWIGRLARLDGVTGDPRTEPVEGRLTPAALELLSELPGDVWLWLRRDGRLWCESEEGRPDEIRAGFGLWLDPWQTGPLEARLLRAWWGPAQAWRQVADGGAGSLPAPRDGGRVSRQSRATVLVGWDRIARYPFSLSFLLLGPLLPLPFALAVVIVLVVTLTVFWTADGLLVRWYRRS